MRYASGTVALIAGFVMLAGTEVRAQEPNFGRAVVMTAQEMFIGQPVNWYGPGVVYTYRLGADGSWAEQSRLTASDTARKDDFGRAIAVDGNTLVVGAPRKRDGTGVVYVFQRSTAAGGWRQSAVIEAPASGAQAEFGSAVALAGDAMLVSAPDQDSTGVVYQFRRSGSNWRQTAVLKPASLAGKLGFGSSLSQAGDWLAVGAPSADSGAGKIVVFRRQPDGSWEEPDVKTPPRSVATAGANVGATTLLQGNRLYVGAPGAEMVLYLDRDSAGAWTPTGVVRPFDVARGARFGTSMAVVGDELWVGAPGVNGFNGRVYRFIPGPDGAFLSAARFEADSATASSWPFAFGYSLASSGDQAVVGMPYRDFGEGRALVVTKAAGGWAARQTLEGQIFRIGNNVTPAARCRNGKISDFKCNNMELLAHVPISALGGERGVWVNDVWGWTDPETGHDYALVARRDGTSFVDVTDPAKPRLVGNLPRTHGSPPSVWRDIKVLNNHAYIVADGAGEHGVQIFDLTRLREASTAPRTFEPDARYAGINSAHNIVADTASGFLYVVGANSGGESCGGGLHMVDARDPEHLVFAGCYTDKSGAKSRGYTHDAQCLVYRGPDARYRGKQICVGSNETEINIADVTDKSKPVPIGRNSYPNVAYAHQGWFDDEQRYFYMNDELDEQAGTVEGTRTIVWDLAELDDPIVAYEYIGPVKSSDHNLFVKGNRVYESNYGSGLRVLDISDRKKPKEIAFFDSAPYNDDGPGHSADQSGAWSNYPFFKNGIVVFTSVREGLFIVKVDDAKPIP